MVVGLGGDDVTVWSKLRGGGRGGGVDLQISVAWYHRLTPDPPRRAGVVVSGEW